MPSRTIISKRGQLAWSSEDTDGPGEASTPKKKILSTMDSPEEMSEQIKSEPREGQ